MTETANHEPVRKHVKPAHPDARIPDPAHPGLFLPPDGVSVPWDHHWILRERRGEIVVTDATDGKAVATDEHSGDSHTA